MGYCLNGVTTDGLPVHLIKLLVDNYDVPFFVETGTASGDSARLAATLFKKVWTIEVIEERPAIKDAPKNIMFLEGDSAKRLPEIIKELNDLKGEKQNQYVVFFLDAHYSGDTPNETEYPECPLLEEIEAIGKYGEDAIIIIDDARLFFGDPPHPHDPTEWPSINEVFSLLKEHFPYHHITITDDYVLAIPIHVRKFIDEEWRNNFKVRYPSAADKLRQQVKDVYQAFIQYIK